MSAHVRENLQYPVVGRAGSACNSRDAQDILARASPSENYSALPVQCQDRFISIFILLGKIRVNRHIRGVIKVSRIALYSRKHGIIAHGVVILPVFSRVKWHRQSTLFVQAIWAAFGAILHGKTRCFCAPTRVLPRRNAYLGRFGCDLGVHFGVYFGTRVAICTVKHGKICNLSKHSFYTVKHG